MEDQRQSTKSSIEAVTDVLHKLNTRHAKLEQTRNRHNELLEELSVGLRRVVQNLVNDDYSDKHREIYSGVSDDIDNCIIKEFILIEKFQSEIDSCCVKIRQVESWLDAQRLSEEMGIDVSSLSLSDNVTTATGISDSEIRP